MFQKKKEISLCQTFLVKTHVLISMLVVGCIGQTQTRVVLKAAGKVVQVLAGKVVHKEGHRVVHKEALKVSQLAIGTKQDLYNGEVELKVDLEVVVALEVHLIEGQADHVLTATDSTRKQGDVLTPSGNFQLTGVLCHLVLSWRPTMQVVQLLWQHQIKMKMKQKQKNKGEHKDKDDLFEHPTLMIIAS